MANDGPVCDAELVKTAFLHLKNTTAIFISIVDSHLHVEKMPSILKWFQWALSGKDGTIRCREKSGEGVVRKKKKKKKKKNNDT